jgi:hypothetical protein
MINEGTVVARASGAAPIDKRRARNIVLCSDGTGNSGGKGNGTNVYRIFEAIDIDGHRHDPKVPPQIAFYDDGVGTEEFRLFKLFGGAFGWGLSRNIRDLYKLLVTNYAPGDSVYLFGFSRGAFTVRSLGGLICRVGVVNPAHDFTEEERREIMVDASAIRWLGWLRYQTFKKSVSGLSQPDLIDKAVMAAFRRYRRRNLRERPLMPELLRGLFRALADIVLPGFNAYPKSDKTKVEEEPPAYYHPPTGIRCIGVWDTVGALGMPAEWMRRALDAIVRINFHSTDLHPSVRAAYHALAIDDERQTFHPVLWAADKADPEQAQDAPLKRPIEQVWFAGAHSNVGGGYPKQGMANVALYWMQRKARAEQLVFYDEELERARRAANVNDKLYDPRSGFGAYYRYMPRDLTALTDRYKAGDKPKIHASVFERIASGVQDYGPPNLAVDDFEVVDDSGSNLHMPWTKEVTGYVRARKGQLAELRKKTHSFVKVRQLHYDAMLITTIAIVVGTIDLRFGVRAWIAEKLGYTLSERANEVASAAAPQASFASELIAGSVRLSSQLTTLVLPEGSHRVVAPAFDYLAKHPERFVLTVATLAVLLWLREVLRKKTDRRHLVFWEGLRRKLRERADLRADPDASPESQAESAAAGPASRG